jgi:Peptide methionine sulfoxide reductase
MMQVYSTRQFNHLYDHTQPNSIKQTGSRCRDTIQICNFFHNEKQQEIAQLILKELAPHFDAKLVTEVSPLTIFYEAEKEHQAYYKNNQNSGYCSYVINPKLQQLRTLHADKLK